MPILLVAILLLLVAGGATAFVMYRGGAFDSQPPKVEASSDETDVTLKDGKAAFVLTVTAEDDFGLGRIVVQVDGKQAKVVTAKDQRELDEDVELTIDSAGAHVVRVVAVDRKGNSATADRVKLTVREPEPQPTITGDGALPGGHPAIGGSATEGVRLGSGDTPRSHVERFHQAVVDGKWSTAYELLPADKKALMTEAQFAEQYKAYGATGFRIVGEQDDGGTHYVTAALTTSGGEFNYRWTFEQRGSDWYLLAREVVGLDN